MQYSQLRIHIEPSKDQIARLVQRPEINQAELSSLMDEVFEQVRSSGDRGLIELTKRFDQVAIDDVVVHIDQEVLVKPDIPDDLRRAIDQAYANIASFHRVQQYEPQEIETTQGVTCWREMRAIQSVGLYVPGGTAPLFSTVLMLAIPAQIAGCANVVLCTPPRADGSVHPAILYAAARCGLRRIYMVGGAQAIAGMVFGTETIPRVNKVFGPGNQYVTTAKMKALEYGIAIDLPAGPSEVLVYADETCYPEFVAADLISQAEHGADSQVILVATTEQIVHAVNDHLIEQLDQLPRKLLAIRALGHGFACVIKDVRRAFDFINDYAPEHLILALDNGREMLPMIRNAGSVFIGHWTPESVGDYASGTNHTLPTSGYAKSYSGLSLDSFVKKITFQEMNPSGLNNLGATVITMAEHEKLAGHANSVSIRMKRL